MKKFVATFDHYINFAGGHREETITKVIEAKTLNSARNKARKMEEVGFKKSRNLLILASVCEA